MPAVVQQNIMFSCFSRVYFICFFWGKCIYQDYVVQQLCEIVAFCYLLVLLLLLPAAAEAVDATYYHYNDNCNITFLLHKHSLIIFLGFFFSFKPRPTSIPVAYASSIACLYVQFKICVYSGGELVLFSFPFLSACSCPHYLSLCVYAIWHLLTVYL